MIAPWSRGRVFAHAAPADELTKIAGKDVREATSGDLYLFVSRDRTRAKVLFWDGTGLCVYAKRLEQGRFAALWSRLREGQVELSSAELSLFLEGCREVGRRRLSPPPVNPERKIYRG